MDFYEIIFEGDTPKLRNIVTREIWSIHRDIFIPKRFEKAECTEVNPHRNGKFIWSFKAKGIYFHKDMPKLLERPVKAQPGKAIQSEEGKPVKIKHQVQQNFDADPNRKPAKAPYNFVPLETEASPLPAQYPDQSFARFHPNTHSGTLQLEIKALTPVFTRGKNEKSFQIDGEFAIPGSSLRGMIRNLCEIMGYSQFAGTSHYTDKRYFQRNMATKSQSDIKKYYESYLKDEEGKSPKKSKVRTGFLNFDPATKSYFIIPSDRTTGRTDKSKNEFQYLHIPANQSEDKVEKWEVYTGLMGGEKKHWVIFPPNDFKKRIDLSKEDVMEYEEDRTRRTSGDMENLLEETKKKKDGALNYPYGVPVFFCEYADSKGNPHIAFGHTRYFRLPYHLKVSDHVPPNLHPDSDSLSFVDALFGKSSDTENDELRAGKVYFEDARAVGKVLKTLGLPQVLAEPNPTSFQLYLEQKRHGIQTPELNLRHWGSDDDIWLRGYKMYWHKNQRDFWKAAAPQISIGHFEGENDKEKRKSALKWIKRHPKHLAIEEGKSKEKKFKNILLKGDYRFFPPELRNFLDAIFFPSEEQKKKKGFKSTQFTPIEVLNPATIFTSRIRFENLTDEELGLLLLALDLPEIQAHKLGMGKSIGLGSVRITPTLHLDDKASRYGNLFESKVGHDRTRIDGGAFATGNPKPDPEGQASPGTGTQKTELISFKAAFCNHLKKHLEEGGSTQSPAFLTHEAALDWFWERDRLQHLKAMLTLRHDTADQQPWDERTAYMPFAGKDKTAWRNRHVLPTAIEVTTPKTYKNE